MHPTGQKVPQNGVWHKNMDRNLDILCINITVTRAKEEGFASIWGCTFGIKNQIILRNMSQNTFSLDPFDKS